MRRIIRAAPAKTRLCDFADGRGGKLILVAHCVLNQNARDAGTAESPATMKLILAALAANDIGIIQLPCPELMVLGLGRQRATPPLATIRERLQLPDSQVRLGRLVEQVVYQIREYRAQGFRILGILGKNGSPTCGVRVGTLCKDRGAREGIFIHLLKQRLHAEGLDVAIHGIDEDCQQRAIDWVLERCR